VATFGNSIGLLSSTAFPSSQGSSVWLSNASPNIGNLASICVAEQVLQEFNIPYDASSVPTATTACTLPAYDINNMPAIQAIKLSLAAFLKDGEFWDLFVNGEGIVEFVQVYPNPRQISLDVRTCLPTSLLQDEARVVIVRGYDSPPIRSIKPGDYVIPPTKTEGELTPQQVVSQDCVILSEASLYGTVSNETTCEGRPYHRTVVVSYKDPVLQKQYKDGVLGAIYDPQAFESITGYIIDFDTHNSSDLNVTYQQSSTTAVSYALPYAGLTGRETHCAVLSNSSEYAAFASARFAIGTVDTTDRYGETWPVFLGVSGLKVVGNMIHQALDARAGGGPVTLYVDERIVHVSPPANKNWLWTYESGEPVLYVFSPIYDDGTTQDYIQEILSQAVAARIYPYRPSNAWTTDASNYSMASGPITTVATAWPNLGAGIGTLVHKLVVTVDIDRPSMVVSDPRGNALTHARSLVVTYYPIVMTDVPPPIAYNIAGVTGTVDHTLDIFDNDPSTVQPPPSSLQGSLTWLEAQKTGASVDISLPFLETESECLAVANLIYNLYNNFGNNAITSYTLSCGPDDVPVLGARVAGYDNNLRVNEINYSYQDGSSYSVNVSLGSIFENVGSWNTSTWQRKTETVQRQGILTWSAGDGVTYRVRIQGLGEYYALNASATGNYIVGEKVSCTIYNNPVESI